MQPELENAIELEGVQDTDKFLHDHSEIPNSNVASSSVEPHQSTSKAREARKLSFVFTSLGSYTLFLYAGPALPPFSLLPPSIWKSLSWPAGSMGTTIIEQFASVVPGVTKDFTIPQIPVSGRKFYFFHHGMCVETKCFPFSNSGFIAQFLAFQAGEASESDNRTQVAKEWEEKFVLAFEKVSMKAAWFSPEERVKQIIKSIEKSKDTSWSSMGLFIFIVSSFTFLAGFAYPLSRVGEIQGYPRLILTFVHIGAFFGLLAGFAIANYPQHLLLESNGISSHRGTLVVFVFYSGFFTFHILWH
ncbi:hypothetical protein CJJ09_004939 [Candidozyma auris]|nr:hypothetical protein CJJ09_004939 [[Candida] auris]